VYFLPCFSHGQGLPQEKEEGRQHQREEVEEEG
jgi:hypothetical protein